MTEDGSSPIGRERAANSSKRTGRAATPWQPARAHNPQSRIYVPMHICDTKQENPSCVHAFLERNDTVPVIVRSLSFASCALLFRFTRPLITRPGHLIQAGIIRAFTSLRGKAKG